MYEPKAHGCRCDECPLQGQCCVPPQTNTHAKLVIVGEVPSKNDTIDGTIFSGATGFKLDSYLQVWNYSRAQCHVTNAVLCKPHKKLLPQEWRKAIECCRPRLVAELTPLRSAVCYLALGAKGFQSLTGKANLKTWHGCPMWLDGFEVWLVPTFHPQFAMRAKPAMLPVIRRMVGRAVAIATDQLDPERIDKVCEIHTEPGAEMQAALWRLGGEKVVAVDVESAGLDPMTSPLICVGIGTSKLAVSVPKQVFCGEEEGARLFDILRNPNIIKVMHNGQHDVLSLESVGFEVNGFSEDTLLLHAILASQLPHDLQFVASCETTYEAWKAEFRVSTDLKGSAVFANSPMHDLQTYNAKDVLGTAKAFESMRGKLAAFHRGPELYGDLISLNDIAIDMRRYGALSAPAAREEHRVALTARMAKSSETFHARWPDVQLGKVGQHNDLKKLFFETFGCTPLAYSDKTEGPKLDAFTLKEYSRLPDPRIQIAAKTVLEFRQAAKLLSTYVEGLPAGEDHVVHATWKPHGPVTGRWACSEPNLQNCPTIMRNIFVPRPGYTVVSADFGQLELRIVAVLSGCKNLLELFSRGVDIHQAVAEQTFGEICKTLPAARNAAKVLEYSLTYGGTAETTYGQIAPKFPDLRFDTVAKAFRNILKQNPEIRQWQAKALRTAIELGYVEEPLSGRREYFHDGMVEPTKVYNFPVQAMAGTLLNRAVLGLVKELDWRDAALLFQVHDELVLEVKDVDFGIDLLRRHMVQTVGLGGISMDFPIEVCTGLNWRDMEEVK